MRHPIESVLREIDSLPEAADTVSLKVPDKLSLRGSSVPSDIAWAIVADRLLTRGYEPDEDFIIETTRTDAGGGVWRFKPNKDLKPGEYALYSEKGFAYDFGVDK